MPQQPLDYFSPPNVDAMTASLRALRRVRRVCGFITLTAFIFAGFNSSDRNPLQWPSTFVFMGCLFVYLFMVAAVWVTAQVQMALGYRSRRNSTPPSETPPADK